MILFCVFLFGAGTQSSAGLALLENNISSLIKLYSWSSHNCIQRYTEYSIDLDHHRRLSLGLQDPHCQTLLDIYTSTTLFGARLTWAFGRWQS